jgi:hypothetical protein
MEVQGISEEELTTPKAMPNVSRVLVIATDVENAGDIYNDQTTFSVLPISHNAPPDSLASSKVQSSTRHYAHEWDLPEGWSLWEWEEFDGYDFSPKYGLRDHKGRFVYPAQAYRMAKDKSPYQPEDEASA